MDKVLVLITDTELKDAIGEGLSFLEAYRVSYALHLVCPLRAPQHLSDVVKSFGNQSGKIVVCYGPDARLLASEVSSMVATPVLLVPTENTQFDKECFLHRPTAMFPLAIFPSGSVGFLAAVRFSFQILALQDVKLSQELQRERRQQEAHVVDMNRSVSKEWQVFPGDHK